MKSSARERPSTRGGDGCRAPTASKIPEGSRQAGPTGEGPSPGPCCSDRRKVGENGAVAKRAVAPDGREWVVRRHWVPRLGAETWTGRFRRRFSKVSRRGRDVVDVAGDGCVGDIGDGFAVAVVIVVIAAVAIFFVIPAVVAIVDLLIVLAVAVVGVLGRVLLRRPWVIEATDGHLRYRWRAVGWRASRRTIDEIAGELAVGLPLSGEPVLLDGR